MNNFPEANISGQQNTTPRNQVYANAVPCLWTPSYEVFITGADADAGVYGLALQRWQHAGRRVTTFVTVHYSGIEIEGAIIECILCLNMVWEILDRKGCG